MTNRQKQFCTYVQQGMEKGEAAAAAGYGCKNPVAAAARLLRNEEVRAYLASFPQDTPKQVADHREILAFLTAVLRSDDETVAVRDKMRAAELLGKNSALFSGEREEVNASVLIYGEKDI